MFNFVQSKSPVIRAGAAAAALAGVAVALFAVPTPASAESIRVNVDEARIIELNRPITQVIVGNPAVADVTVQNRKTLIFTGKSAGHTNIILLDENDRQILNEKVYVDTSNEPGLVMVQRGGLRSTYQCGTVCNSSVAIGDDPKYSADVLKATEDKLQFARNAATGNR
jgi:hypothetical protein